MASFTNKDIYFLSNQELIDILRSLLGELDIVAAAGAHRSTTYLAVSAIEGLFDELWKLLRVKRGVVPPEVWPKYEGGTNKDKPKEIRYLSRGDKEQILQAIDALPRDFAKLYEPVRRFRNYMHPDRELKEQTPIDQSIAQLALACLNAIIEKYSSQRFAAMQQWQLEYGLAEVLADGMISMPQIPGGRVSLLVSENQARSIQEITFDILVPPDAIFNFVYNYFSLNRFRAARIEGRVGQSGRGADNGQVLCTRWGAWAMSGRYTEDSEPDPNRRRHTMRAVLNPPDSFALMVDGKSLALDNEVGWDFDPDGKIGFMTELGPVSVVDLQVRARKES